MKYCSKCGKEIMDQAVICVHCGCAVNDASINAQTQQAAPLNDPNETSGLATAAIVFAILIPIVGLILGIVGANKYKSVAYKGRSIFAIFLSIIVWITSTVILMNF